MSKNLQQIFERNKNFPWQTMGEETLIIEPQQQMSHEISGSGSYIWEMINGERSLAAIAEAMGEVFDAPMDSLQADVLSFVSQLEAKGLVLCQSQ